jgi:molybdenum cofactor biosynthesis enzyme
MEFILLHRPTGPLPLENVKATIELAKKVNELIPNGKPIAKYVARSQALVVSIVDVPNAEDLMPFCEQLNLLGINTEIIPADKMEVAIPKMENAVAQATKRK